MGKDRRTVAPEKTGRPFKNLRDTFNGILWVMCTGTSWRDIPERCGKWNAIYKCFVNWSDAGVFEKIFEILSMKEDFAELSIDSTYVKAHKASAGAKKGF